MDPPTIKILSVTDPPDASGGDALSPPRIFGEPVAKFDWCGCEYWDVLLAKRDDNLKYGLTHSNGKAHFLKSITGSIAEGEQLEFPEASSGINPPPDSSPINGDEFLNVKKVIEGALLDEWNQEHPDAAVRLNDVIVSVNGARTVKEMQFELRDAAVQIRILRYAHRFEVSLAKREEKRKLGFKFKPDGHALRVTEVSAGGLLDEANRKHISEGMFHLVVTPGMRIEAANGSRGSASAIADQLRHSDAVHLALAREDREASERRHHRPRFLTAPAAGDGGGGGVSARTDNTSINTISPRALLMMGQLGRSSRW